MANDLDAIEGGVNEGGRFLTSSMAGGVVGMVGYLGGLGAGEVALSLGASEQTSNRIRLGSELAIGVLGAFGTSLARGAAEETVTLYHGSRSFVGDSFDLGVATRLSGQTGASYTPRAGIYLTDDFARAATGYGRDGVVVSTTVPRSFADSIRQMGGPMGNQPEYFVNL